MPIQSIEPRRLYREIADQLRKLIAAGEFRPGSKLPPERDLARQMGVSRPCVREAMVALEVEGLVEVRIGSGVTVREAAPATSTVRVDSAAGPFELLRARRAVEGECAALAAARIRPVEIEQIAAALEEMRAQIAAGKAPVPADCQFHVRIANATGNSMLARLVDQLNNERFGPLYQRFDWHIFNQSTWNATLREHEAVLAALRARDPEAARRAMHRHLDGAYKRFSKGWGERRGSSTTPAEPRRASVRRGGTQARTTRP